MGYRSDVTCVLYDGKDSSGDEVLAKLKTRFPEVFDLWPAGHWSTGTTPAVFTANYTKWYEKAGFRDVDAFNAMLRELEAESDDPDFPPGDMVHWEFGRIGEDMDDTEYTVTRGCAGHLELERSFSVRPMRR
jgi:hypothetical protein